MQKNPKTIWLYLGLTLSSFLCLIGLLTLPLFAGVMLACGLLLFFVCYHLAILNYLRKNPTATTPIANETNNYLKELQMARKVQQALLQVKNPAVSGLKIAKKCIPAESVGGDFYTFCNNSFDGLTQKPKIPGVIEYIDSRQAFLGIAIGDVAGHGISSALVMALSSGLFNELSKSVRSPAQFLTNANQNLASYIENSQILYVTAFYGTINLDNHLFTYAKAGHPPIILQHADNSIEFLQTRGVFLGMFEDETYEENEIQLQKGDRLFFYTDGLTEARNPKGDLFDTTRFIEVVTKNQHKSIDDVMDLIFKTVNNFTNNKPADDDQTLIIIEVD